MSYRIYFLVSRVSTQCRSRTYPVASGPPYNALNAAVSQLCLLHYLLRLWLSTKMPLCATPHSTAPIMQLAQFVALCHAQSFRPSRITSYVSAIAYVHKIKGLLNLGEAFLVKKTPSRYAPVPMHRQTAPIYTDPNSHFDNSSTVSGVI